MTLLRFLSLGSRASQDLTRLHHIKDSMRAGGTDRLYPACDDEISGTLGGNKAILGLESDTPIAGGKGPQQLHSLSTREYGWWDAKHSRSHAQRRLLPMFSASTAVWPNGIAGETRKGPHWSSGLKPLELPGCNIAVPSRL